MTAYGLRMEYKQGLSGPVLSASLETRPSCNAAYHWVIFQIRTRAKGNRPQAGSVAKLKLKLPQEKEHERSMKHGRKQPTTRGGSNEIVAKELVTARLLLVLRPASDRRY